MPHATDDIQIKLVREHFSCGDTERQRLYWRNNEYDNDNLRVTPTEEIQIKSTVPKAGANQSHHSVEQEDTDRKLMCHKEQESQMIIEILPACQPNTAQDYQPLGNTKVLNRWPDRFYFVITTNCI